MRLRLASKLLCASGIVRGVDDRVALEARYANHFDVGCNAIEVVIDFGQAYGDEPRVHTRIVTSPFYASQLIEILAKALRDLGVEAPPGPGGP